MRRRKARYVREHYRHEPPETWTGDEVRHYLATCTEPEYWAWWEAWSRRTRAHPKIRAIRRSVLDMALGAARSSFPHEFGAMLRVKGDTVTELVLLPIIQGDAHTIMFTHQLPVDRTVRGTLHSHPDPHPYPSDDDFAFFQSEGSLHLILCEPYGPTDWRAYDHTGHPVDLAVVDDPPAG